MTNTLLCVLCEKRPQQDGKLCHHCKNYPDEARAGSAVVKQSNAFLYPRTAVEHTNTYVGLLTQMKDLERSVNKLEKEGRLEGAE